MARQPVLTDGGEPLHPLAFNGFDLSDAWLTVNDHVLIRLAQHLYLKRDGGEQEPMGAAPGQFRFACIFLGDGWSKRYISLIAAIRRQPRGSLTHPILGELRVACQGISDATCDPGAELNAIRFSISFVEDAVDTALSVDTYEGPATRASAVTDLNDQLTTATASYAATATAAVTSLTTASAAYALAASEAATAVVPDASLAVKLQAVRTQADATIAALLDDTIAATVPSRAAPAMLLAEQVLDACNQLQESVLRITPALIAYTVQGATTLPALATRLYGRDGIARTAEILVNNQIPNPAAIPAGTVLRVAVPTV